MNTALFLHSRDDELLAAVAEGDREAFAELYDRFAPHVFARASSQAADSRSAGDVVRDLFVEFWRQAPQLHSAKANVAAWLLQSPQLEVRAEAVG